MTSRAQEWSAERYARNAAFVPAFGASLVDLLAPRAGERILDVGCGDGTLTRQIAERGATVVGIDASADFVAAATRAGIDARLVDARALPFEREFDAVFSNAVLHWIADQDAVVAGIARALRPGGRFVAEFGGHGNIAAIVVAFAAVSARHGRPFTSPWYYPTPEEYGATLEAHGFRVESIELYPRLTPLPTGMRGWIDTFGGSALAAFGADERRAVVDEIEDLLRPALCDNAGQWTADYVRLRCVARC